MKKSFMTRALAMGLSLAMAFSLSAATNVSVASAASKPAMASKQFAVRVGGAAKSYKASAATQKSYKITKATVGNTDKATVKVNSSKKSIKVTPGTVTGTTVVTVTFKNIKTAKSTAKKYRCVVKAAIEEKEPEKPVEEVKATKITEAKAASAKTISVTFDGVVDTSSATAIKVERGATAITVTPKYADDKKSVVLTSDTTLAAGTYTVTVGSMTSEPFIVTKQTPTTIKVVNTTVANDARARVYFQVLDQYNDVMENYTEKKLEARAYNATKGHDIQVIPGSKKDYLMLDCSTETVTANLQYLNAIGDKIGLVVYLKDNAAVSCTAELEIVRVYFNELTFGDVKLGNDKRVTENRTYELPYTAKNNEGNEARFDQTMVTGTGITTKTISNYHFISSNPTAVPMNTFRVNADGNIEFVAGKEGTTIITAINTITGETSSTQIVVSKPAQLSGLEVADATVAWNAEAGSKIKAAVVAYDQFGEVIDPRNVKNTALAIGNFDTDLFSSIADTPSEGTYNIHIDGITSDGKYVQYSVKGNPGFNNKGRSLTYTFVSKAMGENGYIRSTATVTIDDEIEASALEIVKAPNATASENDSVKLQVAVKDQYQNKMQKTTASTSDFTFTSAGTTYELAIRGTNGVLSGTKTIDVVPGESRVYEIKLNTASVGTETHEPGTITLELKEGQKVIASKTFDLTLVKTITKYTVKRDKGTYKAGDKIAVDVEAYSGKYFNKYYNGTVSAKIVVSNAAVTNSTLTKDLTFKDGVASFELTAGKEADDYEIIVTNQNDYDGTHFASGTSDKFNVVKNEAGKLVVNDNGKLQLTDSQGNATEAWLRNAFATIKVMDDTKNVDITSSSKVASTSGNWDKKNDNTVEIEIGSNNVVSGVAVSGGLAAYDMGNLVVTVPDTSKDHIILLSITINGFTWEKKVDANGSTSVDFAAGSTAGNRYIAEIGAKADLAAIKTFMTGSSVSGSSIASGVSISTSNLASGSSVKITAEPSITSGTGFVVTGCGLAAVTASPAKIGFDFAPTGNVSASAIVKVVYNFEIVNTQDAGGNNEAKNKQYAKYEVEYKANATGGATWTTTVKELPLP